MNISLDSFIDTWKTVITSPSEFYQKMPKDGGYSEPLTFAAINFIVMGIGSAIIGIIGGMLGIAMGGNATFIGASTIGTIISNVIFAPIMGIISLFIVGVIYHILFKIVGGSGSYEGTVRILSYSSATSLLAWIPVVGWIFSLYAIYLYIIGGKYVHSISTVRSAIAIFIPIILIIGLIIVAMTIAGLAVMGMFGGY